jgi:hypothetical protein
VSNYVNKRSMHGRWKWPGVYRGHLLSLIARCQRGLVVLAAVEDTNDGNDVAIQQVRDDRALATVRDSQPR